MVTMVYETCSVINRKELWESLGHLAGLYPHPWLIGGDFTDILSQEEKLGNLSMLYKEMEDFANYLSECGLSDMGYSGSTYTQ